MPIEQIMLSHNKFSIKYKLSFILKKSSISIFIMFFLMALGMISCIPQKKVIYLHEKSNGSQDLILHSKNQYKVRPHDNLLLTISSINPQVTEFFNLKQDISRSGINTYLVSDQGYIYIPVLDSVLVKDMTIMEIQTSLQKKIREHVTDATVIVKLGSFSVTVLGEVGNPGVHSISGDELSILEALGLAGDISDFGNKKNIILIRKEGEASRFVELDLTRRDMVASEYFYLKPGDVIYVEPLKAKNYKLNAGQLSLLIGISSFLLLLLNLFKN
jgi:polysaccharide export outer membrane protein